MEKRKHYKYRVIGVGVIFVITAMILSIVGTNLSMTKHDTLNGILYAIATLVSYLFIFICYKDIIWNQLFCCISGHVLRMCMKKFFDLSLLFAPYIGIREELVVQGRPLRYIIYYFLMIMVYGCVYIAFHKILGTRKSLSMNGQIFAVYMVMLAINLILNNLEPILRMVDVRYYVVLVLCEIAYYILLLCLQWFLIQIAQKEMEIRTTQELWQMNRHQYELTKENIEIINIKCHDLRHQIRNAKRNGNISQGFLDEVEKSISIYDSTTKTGNETLDVILTDKRLRCEAAKIQLSCIADGEALVFMEQSDVISLFGNMLENAIEYVTQIADVEKRFISLTVRRKGDFLHIHTENYFEGELEFDNGLPITKKNDTIMHGYGLKSIYQIVHKYEGSMDIVAQDDLFQLNILIPVS